MLLKPSSLLCSLALILLSAFSSHAQVLYGSLTGAIEDASGAPVPNSKIEVVNMATGVARQATSDERGAFQFNDLQGGNYRVTITSANFSTVKQEGIRVEIITVKRLEVKLQVAAVAESISINASALAL